MLAVSSSSFMIRVWCVVAAATFVAVALIIRTFDHGSPAQFSGTALYASMVYAAVVFVRPVIRPVIAGAIAIGCCWLVETSQLTDVPRMLSERSIVARLILGVQFDPIDLFWYPVGVLPLIALHWWLIRRSAVRRGQ
jgi:hypothetical protein